MMKNKEHEFNITTEGAAEIRRLFKRVEPWIVMRVLEIYGTQSLEDFDLYLARTFPLLMPTYRRNRRLKSKPLRRKKKN